MRRLQGQAGVPLQHRGGDHHPDLDAEGYRLTTEKGATGDAADTCWPPPAAPGRSGSANQCKELGLELLNNQVDVGVRVELPATVFEHITDVVYESKLVYRTKQYGDSGAHLLHEPLRPRGGRERGGHQHRERPLLRRPRPAQREHQLRPAGVQPLHPALQRALPLRQAHRLPVQHAGRRGAGAALRRPGGRPAHQRPPA